MPTLRSIGTIGLIIMCVLVFLMGGCTSFPFQKKVQSGDPVTIQVTCRTKDGAVVYSSSNKPEEIKQYAKSRIFFRKSGTGQLDIIAGSGYTGALHGRLKCFEPELLACLTGQVLGMKLHEIKQVELETREPENLTDKDRFLVLKKERRHSRFGNVNKKAFKDQIGKEPEVGMELLKKGSFTARVKDIRGDRVETEFIFNDGDRIDTPFGPGILTHDGDHYIVTIDAKVGQLIKTQALLGRIIEVDDTMFKIDYGHPFGGETLTCDLEVMSIGDASRGDQS